MSRQKVNRLYREYASEAVRWIVTAARWRGLRSDQAIADAAADLGLSKRRAWALFYGNGEPSVLAEQWDQIRIRAAAALRREAMKLRMRADQHEARADELDRRQLTLFDRGGPWLFDAKEQQAKKHNDNGVWRGLAA